MMVHVIFVLPPRGYRLVLYVALYAMVLFTALEQQAMSMTANSYIQMSVNDIYNNILMFEKFTMATNHHIHNN